jgi:hypothetical protein
MVVVSHDCRSCRVVMLAIYDYIDFLFARDRFDVEIGDVRNFHLKEIWRNEWHECRAR